MKEQFYPGSILCILGYKCTNNCSYCYNKKNGAELTKNMNLDTFNQMIKWYDQFVQDPTLPYIPSIALIGGEPLCYWEELDFDHNLPKLSQIVHKVGKEIRLVSNGLLLTPERRKLLKDYDIHIDISLDGDKISHDKNRRTREGLPTWDSVLEKVYWIMEDDNENLRVRATVGKNNADRAFTIYKFLYDLGCKRYGIEVDTFTNWSEKQLQFLSSEYNKIVEHYIHFYDPDRSCFSLDRTLKMLSPKFGNSKYMDTKFLRPNSIAILPQGNIKINHNFPVWADTETAKLFDIGNIFDGFNDEVIQQYLNHFGLLTESSYYASNDEQVCKNCPANKIMCQNPYNNTFLPRSVWIPNHDIQCYGLRLIALFGERYLKKYGYK